MQNKKKKKKVLSWSEISSALPRIETVQKDSNNHQDHWKTTSPVGRSVDDGEERGVFRRSAALQQHPSGLCPSLGQGEDGLSFSLSPHTAGGRAGPHPRPRERRVPVPRGLPLSPQPPPAGWGRREPGASLTSGRRPGVPEGDTGAERPPAPLPLAGPGLSRSAPPGFARSCPGHRSRGVPGSSPPFVPRRPAAAASPAASPA